MHQNWIVHARVCNQTEFQTSYDGLKNMFPDLQLENLKHVTTDRTDIEQTPSNILI